MYSECRYQHVMWDGIYDNHKDPDHQHELTLDEMCRIMNDVYRETQVWKDKYDEMKEKYLRCRDGKKEE